MADRKTIFSILVPVYNEAETVDLFFARLDPVVEEIKKRYGFDVEVIFTDNCSEDNTFAKLLELAESRPCVKIFRFSRNVGFQRSIISGYSMTSGAACTQIDCDLEDPPELILEFIEKWRAGYKVVYGLRQSRKESWSMRAARSLFYRTVNFLSDSEMPLHAGDFRLIDRRVIDIVCQVNDAEPYLRGLIAKLGFKQIGIPYDRDARIAGRSSFSLPSYIALATEGILQSSIRPLYLSFLIAFLALIGSILLALYYLIGALTGHVEASGFSTIVILILVQFSFIMLVIGINSLYLGRIYRQVHKRPISNIEMSNEQEIEKTNFTYWPGEPMAIKKQKESDADG